VKVQFYLTRDIPNLRSLTPIGQPVDLAKMAPVNRNNPVTVSAKAIPLPKNLARGIYYVAWRIDPGDKLKEFTDNYEGINNNVGYFSWKQPLNYDNGRWTITRPASPTVSLVTPQPAASMASLFLGPIPMGNLTTFVEASPTQPTSDRSDVGVTTWTTNAVFMLPRTDAGTDVARATPAKDGTAVEDVRDAVFADFGAFSEGWADKW
jgi:hypothetical protein